MSSVKHKTTGFTLVETLIYTALLGFMLTGFVSFALALMGAKEKNYAMGEASAGAAEALDFLTGRIKSASRIMSPAKGGSGSVLILSDPENGTTTIGVIDGVLSAESGGVTEAAAGGAFVSNLEFSNLSAAGEEDNVRITFSVSTGGDSREFVYSANMETAVCLRMK